MGLTPVLCAGGREAIARLERNGGAEFGVVVLDLMMPDKDGMAVMDAMRARQTGIPVVVQTAKGAISTVVAAMRAGAFDFVVKPVSPEKMKATLESALKMRGADPKAGVSAAGFDDAAASPMLRDIFAKAMKAARSTIPLLIEGETGVGKEWLARAIRASGPRRNAPFVAVNCGALPSELVESILFGHERGAFTDASGRHEGKFLEADGGTLFLDEVGELPPAAQVKLLRVLQDGEIDPVGSRAPVKTDVRIISATNRDLKALVAGGRFRDDLYYRLNAFELEIPPLRRRQEEIGGLARLFLARYAKLEQPGQTREITPAAMRLLQSYDWPGNIRQLENAIHRAVVLGDGRALDVGDFPQISALMGAGEGDGRLAGPGAASGGEDVRSSERNPAPEPATAAGGAGARGPAGPGAVNGDAPAVSIQSEDGQVRRLEDIEADLIRFALVHYGGRMSEIARRLGIGRSTLYRKIREYKIDVAES